MKEEFEEEFIDDVEEMGGAEIEDLENAMCDLQDAVQELSEEEEEDVTGGRSVKRNTYYKSISGTAWSYFYRLMYTSIPGRIVSWSKISNDIRIEPKGGTIWVYRSNSVGKKKFKVTSYKGYDTYITTVTINFK